jgi:hypothetical protein
LAGLLTSGYFLLVFQGRAAETNLQKSASAPLKPNQTESLGPPPKSPAEFSPDAGISQFRTNLVDETDVLRLRRRTNAPPSPVPPPQFNPDPGASLKQPQTRPSFFTNEFKLAPLPTPTVPPELALPRTNTFDLVPAEAALPAPPASEDEPLPENLRLPRDRARANEYIKEKWENPQYPISWSGETNWPAFAEPQTNRWRIGFAPWRRYTSGVAETPYETPKPKLWHPYQQSILKGDAPIIGQDIFLNLTASATHEFEARRVPTASGVSAARPNSAEFFGQSEQFALQNNWAFAAELFKGETVFQPVHWAIRVQPVINLNYLYARETGVVNPDPRGPGARNTFAPVNNSGTANPGDVGGLLDLGDAPGSLEGERHTTRTDEHFALQEAFGELHLGDLSDNYDFFAVRVGNQPFNSDFRGFIFNDINTAARLFGNIDNNHYQYNLAVFDMREKDTNSELNKFDQRDQRLLILNLYRQDLIWKGYTAQLSFHANYDEGRTHYDENGNIARPAPLGTVAEHDVTAYYIGWAGDGHIGRLNLSHAFYQVLGHDDFNGLAGRAVDINAQMAALELSYDRDWIRYKASFFYASGDGDATDGKAHGFDTILDNPNFTGGPFSWYVHQGFNLGGTSVALKQRNSLVPNLRTSKTEGQANFVNPGVFIFGLGAEIEVTPKLRSFINANYVRFVETDPIKTALLTDKVDAELGYDLSIGFQYRPLLTDNIIISAGFGTLVPGDGFHDIYQTSTDPVPGYNGSNRGRVDDFLYSAVLAVTLTY